MIIWSVHTFCDLNSGESGSGTFRGEVVYSILKDDASSSARLLSVKWCALFSLFEVVASVMPFGVRPFCSILPAISLY